MPAKSKQQKAAGATLTAEKWCSARRSKYPRAVEQVHIPAARDARIQALLPGETLLGSPGIAFAQAERIGVAVFFKAHDGDTKNHDEGQEACDNGHGNDAHRKSLEHR